jgi:hypothetical protein
VSVPGYQQPNRIDTVGRLVSGRKPTFTSTITNDRNGSGPVIGFSIRHSEIVHCSELTGPGQKSTFAIREVEPCQRPCRSAATCERQGRVRFRRDG